MPRVRQKRHSAGPLKKRAAAQRSLTRAFLTFTQAAGSLEKSYTQLQAEVALLRAELERANTDLARSLEENARVRTFLVRVLEGLPCGVMVTDVQSRPQMINPELRRLLHLDPAWESGTDGPLPGTLRELIEQTTDASFLAEQEWTSKSIPGNRIIGIARARVEQKNTEPERADSAEGTQEASPGSEAETQIIWILRDITDQKRIAAEREAARRSNALAEIAAVLAHEIRNPLGSMELFTGLIADATQQMPETRHWVTHLQGGLRSLSATVNNVLHFHSQPCGERVRTSLDRLLKDTVEFLGPLARQRCQHVEIANAAGKVTIAADPHQLQQVFFNLALNAFRAMPFEGKLTIRLRPAPQYPQGIAQVDFQDQGHGMPPEVVDRIFDPGFTTTPGSPGLGLSVCKRVIEQHGGRIEVASRPQQGSTFRIFLPVSGGVE